MVRASSIGIVRYRVGGVPRFGSAAVSYFSNNIWFEFAKTLTQEFFAPARAPQSQVMSGKRKFGVATASD